MLKRRRQEVESASALRLDSEAKHKAARERRLQLEEEIVGSWKKLKRPSGSGRQPSRLRSKRSSMRSNGESAKRRRNASAERACGCSC